MILDALVVYAVMLIAVELVSWYARRARRREWERTHTGLNWKDWHQRQR